MRKSNLLLFLIIFLSIVSCLKEEIDLDELSTEIAFERSLAIPLIYGSLGIEDFTGEGYDSLIITDGDTIKLYLVVDLGFSDTLELGDLGQNWEFEYFRLHHKFINSLPIGLKMQFYLYDSLIDQNLDTIFLAPPDSVFIKAAAVDLNGLVIEDMVTEERDFVSLESSTLDYLKNGATHIIFDAVVPNTGGMVKILDHYSLYFKLGVEVAGLYTTDLDSIK